MRRPPLTGSAFIRLLATLGDTPAPAAREAFAERLSGWLAWTDAIPLSAALDAVPGPVTESEFMRRQSASGVEREVRRVRAALSSLGDPPSTATAPARSGRFVTARVAAPIEPETDVAVHRQRYAAAQQAMEAAIAPLRHRLRATLANASPALGRLAALDAVMEQVVGAQAHVLLSVVPRWLEQRFERLRRDHAGAGAPEAWLATFAHETRALLLAELDFRLQPVEGLLEALRSSSPEMA